IVTISLTIIVPALYLAFRNNSIPNNELQTITVTIKDQPKYNEYKFRGTTVRDIILATKEYDRKFKIAGMTFKSIDHTIFKENVFAGDKVELRLKKNEVDEIDRNTFFNNYNSVYGLRKNGITLVDIELRKELKDKDSKWAFLFVILGLVMLPYGIIKRKPLISMKISITATALIMIFLLVIMEKS
ncbi:MAG: hypothetical protein ACPGD5_10330, partial [Salibacteraceae bacterium]